VRRCTAYGLRLVVAAVLLATAESVTYVQKPEGSSPSTWKHAAPGRPIVLPADHRSHPEYKLEWWYYTGNLTSGDNRRFGYQLTFFRIGVNLTPPTTSRWAVRDLFMAHMAVTDVAEGRHVAFEHLNRAGIEWAGASERTYRVWNENWRAGLEGSRHRLTAASYNGKYAIDLSLEENQPPALHGRAGFSRKGSSPGNASYYYSLTRMPTTGSLTADGHRFDVKGLSWMDHEFGTTFLEPTQAGWDWFSVQLDDGRDLMVFQLRRTDGTVDPRSSGTIVDAEGVARPLDTLHFRLQPGRVWRSPSTGGAYPVEWRIVMPDERLELDVRAVVDSQELHRLQSGLVYWEGAIDVAGSTAGKPVAGRGYLEMTGYSGRPMGQLMAPPQ
jgi:predicted secreted hydrolase